MARSRGFTLIELMVTVSLVAVLLALAAPSFRNVIIGQRLTTLANTLLASIQLGRSEAIKRNDMVRLCRSVDGATCAASGGWEQGWIVLHPGSNSVILVQAALPAGFSLEGPPGMVEFQAVGVGATVASFRLCPQPRTADRQGREVSLTASGRAAVSSLRTGVCP